jgi:endonuclease/exonuclease/phosphatase family metal-dependent hydrolase
VYDPAVAARRLRLALGLGLLALILPPALTRATSAGRALRVFDGPATASATGSAPLGVLAFNIAHGRGSGDDNWAGGSARIRDARLAQMAELIARQDADLVVLNEVDFESSWSGGVNQAERIAARAGYPHRAEQRNIDVGGPGLWFRFGNAILSRRPLSDCRVIGLPRHADWEAILAGAKEALVCTAATTPPVRIVAIHLEHRLERVRIEQVKTLVDALAEPGPPVVWAGDFNSTLPGFPEAQLGPDGDTALGLALAGTGAVTTPTRTPSAEALTFPATPPRSKIDWVLAPPGWRILEQRVLATALSDHRAIVARLEPP